jgi:hypothetical protein
MSDAAIEATWPSPTPLGRLHSRFTPIKSNNDHITSSPTRDSGWINPRQLGWSEPRLKGKEGSGQPISGLWQRHERTAPPFEMRRHKVQQFIDRSASLEV